METIRRERGSITRADLQTAEFGRKVKIKHLLET